MDRHIQTIFCDDIRQEVGGKLSYIGVYSGVMFAPAFPATLLKLRFKLLILKDILTEPLAGEDAWLPRIKKPTPVF